MTPRDSSRRPGRLNAALRVSEALAEPLGAALREQQFEVTLTDDLLEAARRRPPPLIVCEVLEHTEALAQSLLSDARDASLVFIGPTGSETAGVRFNVRELSADVSIAEIVRVCQILSSSFSLESWAAPPVSRPAMSYNVLPRASDAPVSKQSMPAPLLPSSAPPSSRPSISARRVPTLPPALADGAFAEEAVSKLNSELSPELSNLLAAAETRVAHSLLPRQTIVERNGHDAILVLTPEVLAALDDPIGDYDAEPTHAPLSTHPPPPHQPSLSAAASSAAIDTGGSDRPANATSNQARRPPTGPPQSGGETSQTGASPPSAHSVAHAASPSSAPRATPLPGVNSAPSSAPDTRALSSAMPSATTLTPWRSDAPTSPRPPAVRREGEQSFDHLPRLAATPLPPAVASEPSAPITQQGASGRTAAIFEPDVISEPAVDPPAGVRPSSPPTPGGEHAPLRRTSAPPSRPSTFPPPSRHSDARVTVRPTRGLSPFPPAPGVPREAWLTAPQPLELSDADPPPRLGGAHSATQRFAPPTTPPDSERRRDDRTSPPSSSSSIFPTEIPPLEEGDALSIVASAVRSRFTGALVFDTDGIVRRIVLRDGDFITAASGSRAESLVSFLVQHGTLPPTVEAELGHKIPNLGRHAAAALIAGGHLRQDQLWPVLRAHAEFLIGRILLLETGAAGIEEDVPARLRAEPAVFGGATGSEVFIEILRRIVEPAQALQRLGGERGELQPGPHANLLDECALEPAERQLLSGVSRSALGSLLGSSPDEGFPSVIYGLVQLQVLQVAPTAAKRAADGAPVAPDRMDEEALRRAVLSRRELVDNGDYFAVLGVPHDATGYDVRRAYLQLRRQFEPSEILRPATLDLREDVDLIIEVMKEAYDILSDQMRRERYRRAIESVPA